MKLYFLNERIKKLRERLEELVVLFLSIELAQFQCKPNPHNVTLSLLNISVYVYIRQFFLEDIILFFFFFITKRVEAQERKTTKGLNEE